MTVPQQWKVTWECSEAELRALAAELEWTVVSVGRLKEHLEGIEGEVAARGVQEYTQMQQQIAGLRDRANRLLAEVGNEELGWRRVDKVKPGACQPASNNHPPKRKESE
jgi:hypothetical protein